MDAGRGQTDPIRRYANYFEETERRKKKDKAAGYSISTVYRDEI